LNENTVNSQNVIKLENKKQSSNLEINLNSNNNSIEIETVENKNARKPNIDNLKTMQTPNEPKAYENQSKKCIVNGFNPDNIISSNKLSKSFNTVNKSSPLINNHKLPLNKSLKRLFERGNDILNNEKKITIVSDDSYSELERDLTFGGVNTNDISYLSNQKLIKKDSKASNSTSSLNN
jgi:hypothetical protein